MIVAACVAFYAPEWRCPQCGMAFRTLQFAADHCAEHNPDILAYVDAWLEKMAVTYEVHIERP